MKLLLTQKEVQNVQIVEFSYIYFKLNKFKF